jgi:flagellar hook-length control protein FliK
MMNALQTMTSYQSTSSVGNAIRNQHANSSHAEGIAVFSPMFREMLNGESLVTEDTTISQNVFQLLNDIGANESTESVDVVLEQLIAALETCPCELQSQFVTSPEISELLALLQTEFVMSRSLPLSDIIKPTLGGLSTNESVKELVQTLQNLRSALQAQPENPAFLAAAEQAKDVFSKLLPSSEKPLLALVQGPPWKKNADSKTSKDAEIVQLISQTKAQVLSMKLGTDSGSFAKLHSTHLMALQAKSSLNHYISMEGTANAVGVYNATGLHAENIMPSENATTPRLPLSNVSEFLQLWMSKQATRGSLDLNSSTIIKLAPEHLGQIEVKLTMNNGTLSAMITAETLAAKDALESNLSALRASLQNQGITVEKLTVNQQQSNFQSGMFHDGRHRQPSNQGQEQNQNRHQDHETEDWLEVMSILGDDEVRMNIAGVYGSSFLAKA